MRSLYASLTLLLLVSGLAPAAEGYPDANTYQYKTVGDTNLSLHVFNPEGHKPADSRPAAVFFFGGGWNGGSPNQFVTHCRYRASRVMVAVTAD